MFRANLLSLFNQFLQTGGDTAVVETRGRQKLTYGELYGYVLFWSHALARRGIGAGERVLLWRPNSSEWVSRFWAMLLRGAVVVPMDAGASLEFVQRVVHESQVKLILHEGTQPELLGHHPDRRFRPNTPPAEIAAPLQFLVPSL
jgi:acyl-CoA synthetase (AMP-forming)/AMP-acid ligase II